MNLWKNQILEMLYPTRCPICGKVAKEVDRPICKECRKELRAAEEPLCKICGKPILSWEKEYCMDCMKRPRAFDGGCALYCYEGAIRGSMHKIKFENQRQYLNIFGEEMGEALEEQVKRWNPQLMIPVPMYKKKQRIRGFNQAEQLAGCLSSYWSIPWVKAVEKIKDTGNQKELSREERLLNLKGAFVVKEGILLPETVLLVDDVYTTGSTMEAMALLCKKTGAKKVYFVSLCIGRGSS